MEKKSKKNAIIDAFAGIAQKRDNTYTSPTVMSPYKAPVNTTSEFIDEQPKEKKPVLINGKLSMGKRSLPSRVRNPNANPGLIDVSPEFELLSMGGGFASTKIGKKIASKAADVVDNTVDRTIKRSIEMAEPYATGSKRIPMMPSYQPKAAFMGIDDFVGKFKSKFSTQKPVKKEWGLSVDELNTSNIVKKSKDIEKNTDLGIGTFDKTSHVQYDNGLDMHRYSKPGSDIDDVILIHEPKSNGTVAYMRKYGMDDKFRSVPLNEWHIKADMPNTDKELVKFANQELEKVVPIKPTKFENKTISTDGLRNWAQQEKHGYSKLAETTSPSVSSAGKDKLFDGLDFKNATDEFSDAIFKDDKTADEAISRLRRLMEKNGQDFNISKVSKRGGGVVLKIGLPKLKRAFSAAPVVGAAAAARSASSQNKNK